MNIVLFAQQHVDRELEVEHIELEFDLDELRLSTVHSHERQ